MWESFKATPKKASRKTPGYFDYEPYEKAEERMREKEEKRWREMRERERERERARERKRDRDKEKEWHSKAYVEDEDEDEDAYSPRTARRSATTPTTPYHEVRRATPTSTAPTYERRRTASTESIRSAPDSEEIARRRQHSRTLSGDRAPKRQASAEHARPRSSDRASERPRRQASTESVPHSHRDLMGYISPVPMSRSQLRDAAPYVHDSPHERRYTPEVVYTSKPKEDNKYAFPKTKVSPGYTPYDVSYAGSYAHRFGQEPQKSSKGNYTMS
jgi:hypothetical protein